MSHLQHLSSVSPATTCPLNDGVSTLDHLLAELMGNADSAAFDAALDLRWQLAHSDNAESIIEEFFGLRALIEERHYLACYRLRRWLESQLIAWVAPDRHQPAIATELKLDSGNLEQVRTHCIRLALDHQAPTPWTRVSFEFARQRVAV